MATATFLFATAPFIRQRLVRRFPDGLPVSVSVAILFILSIYGGYFGAGLGQIMLAALILYGHGDFHSANAVKNAVVGVIALVGVAIFASSGIVSWPHAVVMMLGATLGGFFGGSIVRRVPQPALRAGVIILGLVLTYYYFTAAPE